MSKMSLTGTDFAEIAKAVEMASKQGFRMITIDETDDSWVYSLLCFYGDTSEVYRLKIDTTRDTWKCVNRALINSDLERINP